MFNTTILDVAIGMIFIYLLLSLLCSAANEMIEHVLKNRARDLERGIRELLESRAGSASPDSAAPDSAAPNSATLTVEKFYNHPLISSLYEGTYAESYRAGLRTKLPSYIPARNFALALMDLVAPSTAPAVQSGAAGATATSITPDAMGADLTRLRAEVQTIENTQVR